MGVATFATLSDGTMYAPLDSFRKHKLSRKVKFSHNWIKQKRRVTRIYTKIANCRQDYLHNVSTEISKNHAVLVVEDLKVQHMSKSAKGTMDNPGRNVAAKSGLNKSILDQGWGIFRVMLAYKQQWRGGMVLVVPPHYTSQTCVVCGHVDPANRPSQAVFSCVLCGHHAHADVNAAQNILAVGQAERLNACFATSWRQESPSLRAGSCQDRFPGQHRERQRRGCAPLLQGLAAGAA